MSEKDTFDKLRRISIDEMTDILSDVRRMVPPKFVLGNTVYSYTELYDDLPLHFLRIQKLEENGWTFESYAKELERIAVKKAIDAYNDTVEFPQGIIDRAREFFPNVKFTPAAIELE